MKSGNAAKLSAILVLAASLIVACDDSHAVTLRNDLSGGILADFTEPDPGQVVRESNLPHERIEPGKQWGPVGMGPGSSQVYFFVRWADTGEFLGCIHIDLTRYKTTDKIVVLASSAEPCPEGSARPGPYPTPSGN